MLESRSKGADKLAQHQHVCEVFCTKKATGGRRPTVSMEVANLGTRVSVCFEICCTQWYSYPQTQDRMGSNMADATPVTGLHTPITNIVPTESTVGAPMLSPGSTGFGDEAVVEEGALVEAVERTEMEVALEGAIEFVAPDVSDLEDVGVASFGAAPRLEAVIGTDERVQIISTKQYPWCVTASTHNGRR